MFWNSEICLFRCNKFAEFSVAFLQVKDYVKFTNLHAAVHKDPDRGEQHAAVSTLELCLHRGRAFNRGLKILDPDSTEVRASRTRMEAIDEEIRLLNLSLTGTPSDKTVKTTGKSSSKQKMTDIATESDSGQVPRDSSRKRTRQSLNFDDVDARPGPSGYKPPSASKRKAATEDSGSQNGQKEKADGQKKSHSEKKNLPVSDKAVNTDSDDEVTVISPSPKKVKKSTKSSKSLMLTSSSPRKRPRCMQQTATGTVNFLCVHCIFLVYLLIIFMLYLLTFKICSAVRLILYHTVTCSN